MRQTRNGRRLRDWFRILLTLLMVILMIVSIAITTKLWLEVEQMTRARKSDQVSGSVYYAGAILPTNFDEEAYEAAYQRYDVENGLVVSHFTE